MINGEIQTIKMNKKGELLGGAPGKVLGYVIGMVVLAVVVGAIYPTFNSGLQNITASGMTFGSLIVTLAPILLAVGILSYFVFKK